METPPTTTTTTTTNDIINPNPHHTSLPSPSTHNPKQPLTHTHTQRSESNPYPTTFIQADTSSFKRVVQFLTGSSANPKPNPNPIPPITNKTSPSKSKPSKLYQRRNSLDKNLRINPGFGSSTSAGSDILSPTILDFPALILSPVTPLVPDPFNRLPGNAIDKIAEEKAIAEKGFYLHPSPVSTPRDSEPRLLPLFPVTSSSTTTTTGYIVDSKTRNAT